MISTHDLKKGKHNSLYSIVVCHVIFLVVNYIKCTIVHNIKENVRVYFGNDSLKYK